MSRPMLIVCPTCETSYQIKPAALGAGRQVRCAHCKNTWFAAAEGVEEAAMLSVAGSDRTAASAHLPADEFGSPATGDIIPPPPAARENSLTVTDAPPLVPQGQHETDDGAAKFDPGVPDHVETAAPPRVHPAV